MFISMNYLMFLVYSFLISPNPMLMILLVILLVISLSTMTYIWISKWLFYVFLLFYLGGMMVLFIYMVSLTLTSKIMGFSQMNKLLTLFLFSMICLKSFENLTLMKMNNLELSKLYFPESMNLMIFLSLFLLLILWVIVKFTKMWQGPLKSLM